MTLQAVIGPSKLKPFTKSLSCLSRYGDEVLIQATPEGILLSATNSSKSAFSRVKLTCEYFDKYKLKAATQSGSIFQTPPDIEGTETLTGQLFVKSLLSILKHKTVEQTVDRCDLSIVEGSKERDLSMDAEDQDSLATRLIVRLHCKHGVVKTHRLLLSDPINFLEPRALSSPTVSRMAIGPQALKGILDHFPSSRASKSDTRLIWRFALNDISIKGTESTGDVKNRSKISTEIKMSADEFSSYAVYKSPISLAFHLREFYATVSLAESLSATLDLRFTEPAAPIYIEFDTDAPDSEYLFIISTTHFDPDSMSTSGAANQRKRTREAQLADEDESVLMAAKKKSLRAVVSASPAQASQEDAFRHTANEAAARSADATSISNVPARRRASEPLFMPGASQLSAAEVEMVNAQEFGVATRPIGYEEFEAMMEAADEEVGMSTKVYGQLRDTQGMGMPEEQADDDDQLAPSQAPPQQGKAFRALFDD